MHREVTDEEKVEEFKKLKIGMEEQTRIYN